MVTLADILLDLLEQFKHWELDVEKCSHLQMKEWWHFILLEDGSRVSSDSIVSDYGLGYREIRVQSPAGTKDFSSILCVQTGSGAHPASCPMGTGVPFPGGKARPGHDADQSPPSSAEVVNE
jgi:hypothetical protein